MMKYLQMEIECCDDCPYSRRGDLDTLNCQHDNGPCDYFQVSDPIPPNCPLSDKKDPPWSAVKEIDNG